MPRFFRNLVPFVAAVTFFFAPALNAQAPAAPHVKLDVVQVSHAHGMLRDAHDEVRKSYYDPKYHGIDIDARYKEYDEKIKNASSLPELMQIVAAYLSGFNDSHLFFNPPARGVRSDPGYRMMMVGDKSFITRVRPGSDAADKLLPGDQVLQFGRYAVNRDDISNLGYYFHVLATSPVDELVVKSPTGPPHTVTVKAMMKIQKSVIDISQGGSDDVDLETREEQSDFLERERLVTLDKVNIWKMAEFLFEPSLLDTFFSSDKARPTTIIDLRGNPGGAEDSLQALVSRVFDHDVKIADRVGRKPMKPVVAKHVSSPYTGKIIVLVDSGSASCSELFARVMQLEHRGTVIGDTSAGAVMEAEHIREQQGEDTRIFYAFSITRSNLIMADGKSLEKVGVIPDEVVLPTAEDLAHNSDPVMTRALAIAGVTMTPAAAGKLFPFEWAKF